jgi:sulfate/thiosulfate-binding protein
MRTKWLNAFALALVVIAVALLGLKNFKRDKGDKIRPILNVVYYPNRELFKEINALFIAGYEEDTGSRTRVELTFGDSKRQARAVTRGLEADVVTLAFPSDIDILVRHGLVAGDWQKRLPNEAQPYYSTIVFVVRKGNPKHIGDWPDLIRPGVGIIAPDPKTSSNGKLGFLAAWGAVIYRGGSENQAQDFVAQLYRHVQVLGYGTRDSTTTFALEEAGDVHLTSESEAIREVRELNGDLEIVYPPVSIRTAPSVTWIDRNVAQHNSEFQAKAYLSYFYTDQAQEIFAKYGYRTVNEKILREHQARFPDIALFPVTLIAKDWSDAQIRFFGENGVFDVIHQPSAQTRSADTPVLKQ